MGHYDRKNRFRLNCQSDSFHFGYSEYVHEVSLKVRQSRDSESTGFQVAGAVWRKSHPCGVYGCREVQGLNLLNANSNLRGFRTSVLSK